MGPGLLVSLGVLGALLGACTLSSDTAQSWDSADAWDVEATVPARHPLHTRTVGRVGPEGTGKKGMACCTTARPTVRQRALARTATDFVGARRIQAKGRRFSFDCSGLARGIYFSQGIDLFEGLEAEGRANGVRLIHRYILKHGRLHYGPTLQPGDLVFFHNTWDSNNDGHLNDHWTHVGVVERVGGDGTAVFISRVSRGVERYRINLKYPGLHRKPKGPVLNDFMRRKRGGDLPQTRYLTGELFAAFGTLTH